jgi:alanyl-tRNA synthetase
VIIACATICLAFLFQRRHFFIMLGRDLRISYVNFFKERGAAHIPSDSLIPSDPTLLFTSAGMVQFKPYFLGVQTPKVPRATTVQKCLRTTDIESVGDTSHCTFFEMLGNFSFGDYFKKEVIGWAWEFIFEVLKLDLERIRVTIFNDDDESFEIWRSIGMPERKIFRMGEDDNFWAAGPNGPCGPDSEIFFDTQANLPPTPDVVWDDKRWLEIWNLVFMQFNQTDGANRTPLPRKNIDTGMGLERTTAAINDLRGPFETDLFAPIMERIQSLSGKKYTSQDHDPQDIAFRRVCDHIRATTFCLADGIVPSNVGRGYVLRRIMRRAVLAGRNRLSFDKPFLTDAIPAIIDQYKEFYPELPGKAESILRYASMEEGQFRRTLETGTTRIASILDTRKPGDKITGDEAFTLFTTYGFPVEMTSELASEREVGVDMDSYLAKMEEHAKISEGNKERAVFTKGTEELLRNAGVSETVFTGYTQTQSKAKVAAILQNDQLIESLSEGIDAQIVLESTPFYAESGGQVGDTGEITTEHGVFQVLDTQKSGGYYFHSGRITLGEIKKGDEIDAKVDAVRRLSIQRNHSATHLLHKALQLTLGSHVQQRGSRVDPDKLRFDFSHDKGMTADEIARVEEIVSNEILNALPIETAEKPIDEAKQMGAMMLFGEKYGDIVRVVKMGDFSVEFCGGIHLNNTAEAGLFRIASEASAAAGIRRIEALTGFGALEQSRTERELISKASATLKTTPSNLLDAVDRIQTELKAKTKELNQALKAAASGEVSNLAESAESLANAKLVVAKVTSATDADSLRSMADDLLDRLKSGAVVLAAVADGKVLLASKVSADQTAKGAHAGNAVKAAAQIVGGGGGGKPDFAQAGGKDPSKLDEALAAAKVELVGKLG